MFRAFGGEQESIKEGGTPVKLGNAHKTKNVKNEVVESEKSNQPIDKNPVLQYRADYQPNTLRARDPQAGSFVSKSRKSDFRQQYLDKMTSQAKHPEYDRQVYEKDYE